jgi:hypothetical protein
MSRGLSTANANASDDQVIRPIVFAELRFDAPTGTLYLHDHIGEITADDWDGASRTWQGLGDFGGIDRMEEGRELSPYGVTLTLSGIDTTIASQVLTDDSVLRTVYLLVGFIDFDRTVIADPHPMWAGYVDDIQVAIGEQSVVRASCESQLAAFNKTNNRRQNIVDHQLEFASDEFYEFLPQMIDARLRWGGATQSFTTGQVTSAPSRADVGAA